jgi:hypothetical protein
METSLNRHYQPISNRRRGLCWPSRNSSLVYRIDLSGISSQPLNPEASISNLILRNLWADISFLAVTIEPAAKRLARTTVGAK